MLTPKREKFAQCRADGMSQADAYRASFDAGKMKPETIQQAASRLMADSKVSARVQELRAKLENKALWTREMSVKALVSAYKIAQGANSASGMTGAVKELNAMHGFNAPVEISATVKSLPASVDDFV
jgi:hypothetical protein